MAREKKVVDQVHRGLKKGSRKMACGKFVHPKGRFAHQRACVVCTGAGLTKKIRKNVKTAAEVLEYRDFIQKTAGVQGVPEPELQVLVVRMNNVDHGFVVNGNRLMPADVRVVEI